MAELHIPAESVELVKRVASGGPYTGVGDEFDNPEADARAIATPVVLDVLRRLAEGAEMGGDRETAAFLAGAARQIAKVQP